MRSAELVEAIGSLPLGNVRLMEVCGTHTMSIAKAGLKSLLPSHIRLSSGPGCPVCVTPPEVMDAIFRLTERPEVTVVSYGDMLRVPGSVRKDSLAARKARGASVEIVYSPMDAVDYAAAHPERQVVFLGVGFETTAPGTGASVLAAAERRVKNYTVLSMLKRVEPALRALIGSDGFNVQGFLCPGHVASIVGAGAFRFLPAEYGLPAVVAGFEPADILEAVYRLCRMLAEGKPDLENQYVRAVRPEGNPLAVGMMEQVFCPRRDVWRGLGKIPDSGLELRPEYAEHDAQKRFEIEYAATGAQTVCRCGEIITGRMEPRQCPLFGASCTPEDPVGPCMVSSEGACAAAYKYQGI